MTRTRLVSIVSIGALLSAAALPFTAVLGVLGVLGVGLVACDSSASAGDLSTSTGDDDASSDAGDATADAAPDVRTDAGLDVIVDAAPEPIVCSDDACVVELVHGAQSACARLRNGTVHCWGSNAAGELGRGAGAGSGAGTGAMSPTPEPVLDLTTATQISGSFSTPSDAYCALRSDGTVVCWGSNTHGTLGRLTEEGVVDTEDSPTPALAGGISGAAGVFVGPLVTCATHANAEVTCWGRNDAGQIPHQERGLETPLPATKTVVPSPLLTIALTQRGSAATTDGGSVLSWGLRGEVRWPETSVLGREVSLDVAAPGPVTLTRVSAIAAGTDRVCAITNGQVQCWGAGQNSAASSVYPAPVGVGTPLAYAQTLSVGARTACATLSDGSAVCWGDNSRGQLGVGNTDPQMSPVRVKGLSGRPVRMATMDGTTCAVLTNGAVECWGENTKGQLGIGSADPLGHLQPESVKFNAGSAL